MATQQLVILARNGGSSGGLAPLGSRRDIADRLSRFNTAADGNGSDVMFGPGIRIEMSPGDPVTQMLLSVVEEEIAWLVIMRIGKAMEWKLLDPMTGREFAP